MALSVPRNSRQDFPFASFRGAGLSLEKGKELEWLLTNGLGGYSSSTVLGLNTRKYHGLLVSSDDELSRCVCLQKLDEEIFSRNSAKSLGIDEFSDRRISGDATQLSSFDHNHDSVSFHYNAWSADVTKRIAPMKEKNGVIVSYDVRNKLLERIEFRVNLLVNARSIYELSKAGSIEFTPKFFGVNALGLASRNGYLKVYSDKATCRKNPLSDKWVRNVFYSNDWERGDTCVEDIYFPAYFSLWIEPGEREEFFLAALCDETEEKTAEAFKELRKSHEEKGRILGSGMAASVMRLLSNSQSFVVRRGGKKTIIAGYHWFGEWGRDAMISLPGTTLINGRLDDAEMIFAHFLAHAGKRGIPNRFVGGKPEYGGFDGGLWLIDRLYQYAKYAGPQRTADFLKPRWRTLKGMIEGYMDMEKDGLLVHKSGTWMDTLERNGAVEMQGLWYNALRIMEKLARVAGDVRFDVCDVCRRFEDNFLEAYWNGSYLRDCVGDDSLRPNQVIVISLDHNVVDNASAVKMLDAVERELLTPYGLRTLSPKDPRYRGQYVGDFKEREESYHNGTVWPWLLGPYIRAAMRLHGDRPRMQELLSPLFEKHILEAGIGTISEIFDGDPPHKPRGCISQAWSVAEPLRAYFEDVMEKRPPFQT